MGEHAQLSPSAAHRWLVCPASVRESATTVSADTDYSKAGTAAHEVLAHWLSTGEPPQFRYATNKVEIQTWMLDHAAGVVNWIDAFVADRGADKTRLVLSEEKVQIGSPFFKLAPEVLWGTADVVLAVGRELVVGDLKTGHVDVVVEKNPQLMLYALGVCEEMGWMFDTIRLVIWQKKCGDPKEWVISKDDLLAWGEEMRPRIAATQEPTAPYVPSDEGCRYCPAAGVCRALQGRAIEMARQEFSAADAVTRLTPEELGFLLSKAGVIETALATAREHAAKLISLGTIVPGWKLVEGRKNRVWRAGLEDKVQASLRVLGFNEEEFAPRELVSPAQAEKLVGKKLVEEFIETPRGNPSLAPEADKRPALPPAMAAIPDIDHLLE